MPQGQDVRNGDPQDVGNAARRLQGCRRYGYRDVPGRVEPGAETECDAGAKAEDRMSGAARPTCPALIRLTPLWGRPLRTSCPLAAFPTSCGSL